MGQWWRSSVRANQHETFAAVASDVTTNLQTLIGRDVEFTGTVRAVSTMQPGMGASDFARWFTNLEGRRRQVGGVGTSVVVRVPARSSSRFQARRNADPAFRALVEGHIEPVAPSGRRPLCLVAAGVSLLSELGKLLAQQVQGDWCSSSSPVGVFEAPLLRTETDTGQLLVVPVAAQGLHTMFFEAAFYRGGPAPATVSRRRAAVLGWVSSSFDIPALIKRAVGSHRSLGVALYHVNPGGRPELIDRAGSAPGRGAFVRLSSFALEGDWRVEVSQSGYVGDALSADLQGLLVLLGGVVVSALLFALILLLARSRERALHMVRAKTGELRHQALHDALTGLPNRVLTLDRAEQMLARAQRGQSPVAALYVDVDGFKHVNDRFGHAAGDELLRMVASRLQSVIREGDTAGRLGGDEFVVLLDGSPIDSGPELVAERVLDVLRQPYELTSTAGRRLSITASVGVAVARSGGADELLRNADLALYQAKAAGRDRSVVFQSSMQRASSDRLLLEMDLADALAEGQFFLLYQPTLDLRSERVVGVEALIRWRHPTRGVVSPVEFIPIAEDTGMIVPIGRWVLEEACRQAAVWAEHGHDIDMAVNVSARQLEADELIDDVRHALVENGLAPGKLTLEVTETALMRDAAAAGERLNALKQLGVRIAIDDFGTGYSSLAYLRQFPADALKIDRSFVGPVATSKDSAALIRTLVQLGRSLEIKTLAEGIEEEAQLRALQREHCDLGQGFLFARPLDADALETFLRSRASDDSRVRA